MWLNHFLEKNRYQDFYRSIEHKIITESLYRSDGGWCPAFDSLVSECHAAGCEEEYLKQVSCPQLSPSPLGSRHASVLRKDLPPSFQVVATSDGESGSE